MGPQAGLARRLAASLYESVVLGALWLAVGFALLPFVTPPHASGAVAGPPQSLYVLSPGARLLSAASIVGVSVVYFAALWSGGRRTLPMKTWRLALRTAPGGPVSAARALARYAGCWVGPILALGGWVALEPRGHGRWAALLLAFNYVWALVDRDRLFLQDRLAGTRLVLDQPRDTPRQRA